ncbi:MAG: DUF1501 domain-containing protein [Acidobacteria bacterium]|nr:DUF1501 domain-containing protein [Acidobacteriota bacterium]
MDRRQFLGRGAGLAAVAMAPWLPRVVFAESDSSSRDVIVSLFMRGGGDGLTLVPPFGESAYYDLRPSLAVPPPDSSDANRAIDLDGFFGFPKAMKPLMRAYNAGDLLVVQGCGLNSGTRSHFEAMHFMEVGRGDPPASLFTGWLGRHLASTAPSTAGAVLRAVGIGAGLQRSLIGAPKALPIQELGDFGLAGRPATRNRRQKVLEEMYAAFTDPLKTSVGDTFRAVDLLKRIGFNSYQPAAGATYPDTYYGNALKSTAALIKADVGVEAVAIDLDGWDTHDVQGPFAGFMAELMQQFADGLAAFHRDLIGQGKRDVVVVAMSEFGRNARENGSAGTDHGTGGVMFVLGGHIRGGQVLADWRGLEREQLFEGQDLEITIDYRDILSEILLQRVGNKNIRQVFSDPSYQSRDYGIVS